MTSHDHIQLDRHADWRTPASRAEYRDQVRSEEERKANAAQFVKNRATLRSAKLAERTRRCRSRVAPILSAPRPLVEVSGPLLQAEAAGVHQRY